MFGLISKKKIVKEAVDYYLKNDTSNDMPINVYRFRCGVSNGLRHLCSKFGIDLTKEAEKALKERSEGK